MLHLSPDHNNFLLPSMFTGNTGSGILLRLSYAHISDNITFEGNMAENGAAIQLQDLSRVRYQHDLLTTCLYVYFFFRLIFPILVWGAFEETLPSSVEEPSLLMTAVPL